MTQAPKEVVTTRVDAECIVLGDDTAGVILDCHGGLMAPGAPGGEGLQDLMLDSYREAGFIDLRPMLEVHDGGGLDLSTIPPTQGDQVRACLMGNKLSLTGPGGELLTGMRLGFTPHWYRYAARGALIVVVGRHLTGMVADDDKHLIRAMAMGQTVGATVPLTVRRPGRNSACPCAMRTGRKFKHCCGRPGALQEKPK